MTVAESYRWSRDVARARARNFYYSFRLLPKEKHDAICAVYAFMRECDDLSDEDGANLEALESWRAQLSGALAGDSSSHPVWPGFSDAVRRFSIPHHIFHEMIDGVESDLEPRRIQTFDELYRYCYQVAAVPGISVVHIFGFSGAHAPKLAEKCGIAFQLTNIIRDVQEDWERRRVYLPAEDLARFGVTDPVDSPEFRKLLEFEANRAQRYYEESRPLLDMVDKSSRAALRALIEIYSTLLERIRAGNYDVMNRRFRLSGIEKGWITARSFLKAG